MDSVLQLLVNTQMIASGNYKGGSEKLCKSNLSFPFVCGNIVTETCPNNICLKKFHQKLHLR